MPSPRPRRHAIHLLAAALLVLAGLGAGAALLSHHQLLAEQATEARIHADISAAQRLIRKAAEIQSASRLYLLSGRLEDRDGAQRAIDALAEEGRQLAGGLEESLLAAGLPPVGATIEHLLRLADQVARVAAEGGLDAARELVRGRDSSGAEARLRGTLDEFLRLRHAEMEALEKRIRLGQAAGLVVIGFAFFGMLAMLLGTVRLLARRHAAAEAARASMDSRGREVTTLFRMGELLQSSQTPEDVKRVVAHTAGELLPELGGAFYVFSNSRDRLDLLTTWGLEDGGRAAPVHFGPADCWALKRGRPHGCGIEGGMRCDHAEGATTCLCVPMQARGEVYGVLQFHPGAPAALPPPRAELAQALADGVSLALANLALREKLRNQALRDELTGLYNRRFLEETLPRLVAHAERRQVPISVLMLDLDHFKQVNDRYGHSVGDAVLREVGGLLQARLRRMDVACRYGGEELMVLMPDCAAQDALMRANDICAMVRGLHDRADNSLPPVTVSIGVAAWPEHGEQMGKVIEAADAALYAAKHAGRDRAIPAEATMPALIAG